jgi:hypothetical protein
LQTAAKQPPAEFVGAPEVDHEAFRRNIAGKQTRLEFARGDKRAHPLEIAEAETDMRIALVDYSRALGYPTDYAAIARIVEKVQPAYVALAAPADEV